MKERYKGSWPRQDLTGERGLFVCRAYWLVRPDIEHTTSETAYAIYPKTTDCMSAHIICDVTISIIVEVTCHDIHKDWSDSSLRLLLGLSMYIPKILEQDRMVMFC